MTERISLSLWEPVQAKQAVTHIWNTAKALMLAGHRLVITLAPETRTQAQNRLMWPLLTAYSKQLQWPINGRLVYMTPDEWKDVLSAAFKGETVRLAMGLDGGVVMLQVWKLQEGDALLHFDGIVDRTQGEDAP